MTELRVPTVALNAEVLCADGQTFKGRVFLPAAASRHTGAMRPQEWMNDGIMSPMTSSMPMSRSSGPKMPQSTR